MTAMLTVPCITCKRKVTWDRIGATWRLVERRGKTYVPHLCPGPSDRCQVWMPLARAYCGMRKGHRFAHRSPEALAVQRAMQTGIGLLALGG